MFKRFYILESIIKNTRLNDIFKITSILSSLFYKILVE